LSQFFTEKEDEMQTVDLRSQALSRLVRHVAALYGGLSFELRGIAVSRLREEWLVRIVEVADGCRTVGQWRTDEPLEAVRACKRADPYLAGRVFLDTGARWVHVDDRTFEPCALFGRRREAFYGLSEMS
jgi:hypothetical protein